jgi:Family of unknown function (DUF5681)
MTRKPRVTGKSEPTRSDMPGVSDTDRSEEEYRVGPGRPPKAFQFKPGRSGNPKGAKRKEPSIATDLKALFERALSKTVKLRQGEKEQIVTKAAAGIEQLVNQFAKGDRHARRDLIALADKLGIDLAAGRSKAIEEAVTADDEAVLADFLQRHGGGRDHCGAGINAGLPQSKDSEDPGNTKPGDKGNDYARHLRGGQQ